MAAGAIRLLCSFLCLLPLDASVLQSPSSSFMAPLVRFVGGAPRRVNQYSALPMAFPGIVAQGFAPVQPNVGYIGSVTKEGDRGLAASGCRQVQPLFKENVIFGGVTYHRLRLGPEGPGCERQGYALAAQGCGATGKVLEYKHRSAPNYIYVLEGSAEYNKVAADPEYGRQDGAFWVWRKPDNVPKPIKTAREIFALLNRTMAPFIPAGATKKRTTTVTSDATDEVSTTEASIEATPESTPELTAETTTDATEEATPRLNIIEHITAKKPDTDAPFVGNLNGEPNLVLPLENRGIIGSPDDVIIKRPKMYVE